MAIYTDEERHAVEISRTICQRLGIPGSTLISDLPEAFYREYPAKLIGSFEDAIAKIEAANP